VTTTLPVRRNPPKFLFYNLVRGCNLKCTHCEFWKWDDPPARQSMETVDALIGEFAALTEGKGTVVTCGGESTLQPARFWAFCASVRRHGLRMFAVTNGTYIKTPAIAERMLLEGPHEITVSLDGPDAAMHDAHRGVSGSFDMACRAVKLLAEARRRLWVDKGAGPSGRVGGGLLMYERPRIIVMTILGRSLIGRLDEFYDMVADLGADKLKLNVVQPSFASPDREGYTDPYFDRERFQVSELMILKDEIAACDSKYRFHRNPQWIANLTDYFVSIEQAKHWDNPSWATLSCQTKTQICNAGDRNITCSDQGELRSCFSGAFPSYQWNAVGDLERYWHEVAPKWLYEMQHCKRLCGISHSNRAAPATLA